MIKKTTFSCLLIILLLYLDICASVIFEKRTEHMTLEEKIGQTMCLDFKFWNEENKKIEKNEIFKKNQKILLNPLKKINKNPNMLQKPVTRINAEIKEIIEKYHIGSIILFSQNFVNKEQVKKLIGDLQKTAKKAGNPPLIICIDQEGGRVERFAFGRDKLKNNAELKTAKEAFEKGMIIGKELKELGINCNFAPVVDVNSNSKNPVINVRSFGCDPSRVSKFGKKFMKGLHSQNIISVAKHFPGHGNTFIDSHFGLPSVSKSLKELADLELKPFQTMIDAGVDMIMSAHIEFSKIENKTIISKKDGNSFFLPATISHNILTDLLRNKMGFNGVIITDAMNMKAISENIDEIEATKMAIQAGADIICMPVTLRNKTDIKKLTRVYETLKKAVDKGEISEKQLNESVERILKLKSKYL